MVTDFCWSWFVRASVEKGPEALPLARELDFWPTPPFCGPA
jgi:hypothetical protein